MRSRLGDVGGLQGRVDVLSRPVEWTSSRKGWLSGQVGGRSLERFRGGGGSVSGQGGEERSAERWFVLYLVIDVYSLICMSIMPIVIEVCINHVYSNHIYSNHV